MTDRRPINYTIILMLSANKREYIVINGGNSFLDYFRCNCYDLCIYILIWKCIL